MRDILKISIRYPLTFTVVSIIWQLIVHQSVDWAKVLGILIFMFIFSFLYEWTKIPYKWKKDSD